MKNKDKYDLRDLNIMVMIDSCAMHINKMLITFKGEVLYEVNYSATQSYKVITIYNDWLESEVKDNVD